MTTPNRNQLRLQYERAKRLGWVPFFVNAASDETNDHYDAADLMGIGSRETNLDPRWLSHLGDGGMAGGLMQADVRSFPEFIHGGLWRDAKQSIIFGARVLMLKQFDYEAKIGKPVHFKAHGNSYSFVGKPATPAVAQHIAFAGYNSGLWSQYAFAHGVDIDKYTTGHDYGADVIARARVFREFLQVDGFDLGATPAPAPAVGIPTYQDASYEVPVELDAPEETSTAVTTIPDDQSDANQIQSTPITQDADPEAVNTAAPTAPDTQNAAPADQATFAAKIPNIDTAKGYFSKLLGGTSVGAALAVVGGAPWYVLAFLGLVFLIILVGFIYIITKYHDQIFQYVFGMNAQAMKAGLALQLTPHK